jgi:hypothetical protein
VIERLCAETAAERCNLIVLDDVDYLYFDAVANLVGEIVQSGPAAANRGNDSPINTRDIAR